MEESGDVVILLQNAAREKPRSRNRIKIGVAIETSEVGGGHANTASTRYTA